MTLDSLRREGRGEKRGKRGEQGGQKVGLYREGHWGRAAQALGWRVQDRKRGQSILAIPCNGWD